MQARERNRECGPETLLQLNNLPNNQITDSESTTYERKVSTQLWSPEPHLPHSIVLRVSEGFFKTTYVVPATVQQQISKISKGILWNMHHVAIISFAVIWVVYFKSSTFPSKFSCCISWSLFPIPMKAQGCDSCSVQPSRSICSFFFFHPLPIRYTHGGGQKNLKMKNTLWDYIHLSWKFLRQKLLCTQSFLSPFTLCIVYTCTPFICLEDFLKCIWKKRRKRKIGIRCTVTEYLPSSIYDR